MSGGGKHILRRLFCACALSVLVADSAHGQTPQRSATNPRWHATGNLGATLVPSFAFVGGLRLFRSSPRMELPYISLDEAYPGEAPIPMAGIGLNAGDGRWMAGASIVYIGGSTSSHVTVALHATVSWLSVMRLEARAFPWHTDDRFVTLQVGFPLWGSP